MKFSHMKYLSFSFLLLATSPVVLADNLAQSFQQTKQQFNEFQSLNQNRWIQQHSFQSATQQSKNDSLSKACLNYHGIQFKGVTLVKADHLLPKKEECINEERLNQLSQQLTQEYIDKGYIHNPFQFEDDHSGLLTLHVFEGKTTALESDDKQLNLNQLLPNVLGKPLKVQDLDQALDQANRIPGNNVTVDVLPAKNGEIRLSFSNEPTSRISGTIGIDDRASKNYGRWQARAAVNIGNPFGLSDTLYLSGAHTLKSRYQFNRSLLLHYSLPYGYWTFSSFASFSQFKSPLILENFSLQQNGRTVQAGISAEYVFHRGANHISTFSTQFEKLNSKHRLEDVVLALQSPTLSSISVGINHLQLFENGNLVVDIRYEQGKNKAEDQPESQFKRWNLDLKFNRYQALGSETFRHSHQLTGQYGSHYLPSVKQEDLTGYNRIRGLNDLNLSAEKNLVLHNDIAWIKQTKIGTFSPYLGFDLGVQKSVNEDQREKALAYAIGLNWSHKVFQANLEWATGRLFGKSDGVKQERFISTNFVYLF